jgi:uncharacterized protein YoxC
MIKSLLIIAGLIAICAVAALVVLILFLNENNKKIQKELREDGYYD